MSEEIIEVEELSDEMLREEYNEFGYGRSTYTLAELMNEMARREMVNLPWCGEERDNCQESTE